MNVGGFSEHQNNKIDTNRCKGYVFTARVSRVNVNKMRIDFEQPSEFWVTKSLLVHVLSSRYDVQTLSFAKKKERNAAIGPSFCQRFCTQSGCVYNERVYTENLVRKFWFVSSFSSQLHSKFIAKITSENVSQLRFKECKAIFFFAR